MNPFLLCAIIINEKTIGYLKMSCAVWKCHFGRSKACFSAVLDVIYCLFAVMGEQLNEYAVI